MNTALATADQIQDPQGTGETVIMDVMKTVTVKPHEATDDTQLDLQVNDIVYVLEQDETGWWGGHKEGEETTGWFPGSCVRPFFEPGTLGHQQLAGVVQEEHLWHQSCGREASTQPTPCVPDEGPRTQSALETEARSPVRRSLLVASPMRGNQRERTGGSSMAIPGTPAETSAQEAAGSSQPADTAASVLATENTKLKQEVSELNDTIKMIKRQSDVDRRNCSEMEVAMDAERARREEAERRLKAESAEKDGLLNEAAVLRQKMEKLEKERQDSKAAMKHVEELYKSKLEDKDIELRRTSEHLESHRRTIQGDKQYVRSLEEQVQALQAQLEEAKRSKEPVEATDHGGAGLCQRRLSVESAVTAVADPIVRQEGQTVVADETRRRLFSSTASDAAAPTQACSDLNASPPAEATRGRALTAASRANTLPLATLGQQPAAATGYAARTTGTVHRPPEPPRAASSAPRIATRSAGSPSRLGHARSTGDLEPRQRAASVDHCLEDAPPRGCVADKVTMFEQRCQTPRRDASELQRLRHAPRSEPHDARMSRTSREDRSVRATPPALPRQVGAAAPAQAPAPAPAPAAAQPAPVISVTPPAQAGVPQSSNFLQVPAPSIQAMAAHFQARPAQEQVLSGRPGTRPRGLELNAEDEEEEEAGADQVDMGMSPICRPQPREASGQQPSGGLLHEPAQAVPMQACSGGLGAAGMAAASGRGTAAASAGLSSTAARPAASRESAVPEVSVLERIRKLEVH